MNRGSDFRVSKGSLSRQLSRNPSLKGFPNALLTSPQIIPSIPVLTMNRKGRTEETSIVKTTFAKEQGLHVRDLRVLDFSPPNRIEAAINPRGNCVLFSLEGIKALIAYDIVYIFSPENENTKKFVEQLKDFLKDASPRNFEHDILDIALHTVSTQLDDELNELAAKLEYSTEENNVSSRNSNTHSGSGSKKKKLDAVSIKQLLRKIEMFNAKTKVQFLRKRAMEVLRALNTVMADDNLLAKLYIKNPNAGEDESSRESVQEEFSWRESEFANMFGKSASATTVGSTNNPMHSAGLSIATDFRESMAPPNGLDRLTLSSPSSGTWISGRKPSGGSPRPPSLSLSGRRRRSLTGVGILQRSPTEDVEVILDQYFLQLGWTSSQAEDLIDFVAVSEADAALQLDIMRNRIMRYNIYLTMATFSVALAGVVPGIFGMNLTFPSDYLYDDPHPFLWVVSMVAVFIPVVYVLLVIMGRWRKIF